MRRKLALLSLYSALLLLAGYIAGRSSTAAAAHGEIRSVSRPMQADASVVASEPLPTDWPDLTP